MRLRVWQAAGLAVLGTLALRQIAGARQYDTAGKACIDNLHRWSVAASQYLQDYDETFPAAKTNAQFEGVVAPYNQINRRPGPPMRCPISGAPYKANLDLSGKTLPGLPEPPENPSDPRVTELMRETRPHSGREINVVSIYGQVFRNGKLQIDPTNDGSSNARSLATATVMYMADYDDTLPPRFDTAGAKLALKPYLFFAPYAFHFPPKGPDFIFNASISGLVTTGLGDLSIYEVCRQPYPSPDGKRVFAYLDGHMVRK